MTRQKDKWKQWIKENKRVLASWRSSSSVGQVCSLASASGVFSFTSESCIMPTASASHQQAHREQRASSR